MSPDEAIRQIERLAEQNGNESDESEFVRHLMRLGRITVKGSDSDTEDRWVEIDGIIYYVRFSIVFRSVYYVSRDGWENLEILDDLKAVLTAYRHHQRHES